MGPEWIWLLFLFAFGSCIGSFLNVVIYRLPRDKSIVTPPSACPSCEKRIRFYDNIPLLSWLLLRGKCRFCGERISPRYFIIELFTALMFVGVYLLFFELGCRKLGIEPQGQFPGAMDEFFSGGWLFYLACMVLLSAFLAGSAIDLELWVIPLSLCWFVTIVGVITSGAAPFVLDAASIRSYKVFPVAGSMSGALAVGAAGGMLISILGLATGVIKRSYEYPEGWEPKSEDDEPEFNHRLEALKEVVFLAPMIAGAVLCLVLVKKFVGIESAWIDFLQSPVAAGVLGSVYGYFIGCGVVWTTRILGTLLFGKEAMGLGDVHLMGAAGAVIGGLPVVLAFFVAPFFGLTWAMYQMIFRKTRQIPYGPFLSMAVFAVMILHDWFNAWITGLYLYQ